MPIQLRRVVYLIMLMQCVVCMCETKELTKENEGEDASMEEQHRIDFVSAERLLNASLSQTYDLYVAGKSCLNLWEADLVACEQNYESINVTVLKMNATIVAIRNPTVESDTKSASFKKELEEGMAKLGEPVNKTIGLIDNAETIQRHCRDRTGNLAHMVPKFGVQVEEYKRMVTGGEKEYLKFVTEKKKKHAQNSSDVYEWLSNVSKALGLLGGRTKACAMNGRVMVKLAQEIMTEAKAAADELTDAGVKEKVEAAVSAIKERDKWRDERREGKKPGDKGKRWTIVNNSNLLVDDSKLVHDFTQRYEKEKKKVVEEKKRADEEAVKERQRREEEERKRKEEEAKRKAEEEERKKKEAEERARREEEERQKAEKEAEKARKKEKEKKAKAAEEERIRKAKEEEEARKAKEEQEKRVAEEAASKGKEELEGKKKKDGSSSPALLHGPLLLLLLCVLGSILVC